VARRIEQNLAAGLLFCAGSAMYLAIPQSAALPPSAVIE